MSRRATDWAWRQDIKATMKLILLSLADRADEYHRAYPSAERIELDTRLNIKTIRSNLKVMQELGIIRDSGKRKGSTKQVVVWELLGIEDDVKHQVPKSSRTTSPEEKVPENGHLPKVPKIGLERYPKTDLKGTQNWVTEPVIEPTIDPLKDLVPSNDELLETRKPESEFEFPTNRRGEIYSVYMEDIFEFRKLYPSVDVYQEFRNMLGWLKSNPARRKTKSGIPRFINSWLAKEQNKGRCNKNLESPVQLDCTAQIENEIRLAESKVAGLQQNIMQHQQWNIPGGDKAIVSFQADIEKLKKFIQQQRQIRERLQGEI
ncbi:helix-turn-helix domain-containing protein [Vibrio alginolyticus]